MMRGMRWVVVGALLVMGSAQVWAVEETVAEPSLYERLGGVYSIASVVDDFIEKLYVNDILNANPAIDEARTRVPKPGLKYQVTAMVCQATGGPEVYTGRNMKETHANLSITRQEWDAMIADFIATLNGFEVPQAEQQELLAIMDSTKADIVVTAGVASVN